MIICSGSVPPLHNLFNQRLTTLPFIYKNNDGAIQIFDNSTKFLSFQEWINQLNILFNLFFTSSRLPNCDVACVWHEVCFDHFFYLWNHGCTEHVNNFFSMKLFRKHRFWAAVFHDKSNFFWEVFWDHFISLINDNPRKSLKGKMSFFEHFFDTTRSTDDNVGAFPQTQWLELNLLTSDQSNNRKIETLCDFNELGFDLFGELSGRSKYKCIGTFFTVYPCDSFKGEYKVQDRKQVGQRFTFTSRRDGNQIFHLKANGQGLHLDGSGFLIVQFLQIAQQDRI